MWYGQGGRPMLKLVPEGRVPYKGPLTAVVYQLIGRREIGNGVLRL